MTLMTRNPLNKLVKIPAINNALALLYTDLTAIPGYSNKEFITFQNIHGCGKNMGMIYGK